MHCSCFPPLCLFPVEWHSCDKIMSVGLEQGVWSRVLNDKSELQKSVWSDTLMLCSVRETKTINVHGIDVQFLHIPWFGESLDDS